MLEIKHQPVSPEEAGEIKRLEAVLDCPRYDYAQHNRTAQADHRVEIPMMVMAQVGNRLQLAKNVHYDNSYSKRGLFSIFFNMERKWERSVSQIFGGRTVGDTASESFVDTCIDLAVYSIKMCAWICARRPDLYQKLLGSVVRELQSVNMLPELTRSPVAIPAGNRGVAEGIVWPPEAAAGYPERG